MAVPAATSIARRRSMGGRSCRPPARVLAELVALRAPARGVRRPRESAHREARRLRVRSTGGPRAPKEPRGGPARATSVLAASTRGRSAPDHTSERAPRDIGAGPSLPGGAPRPITRASVRHATSVLGLLYPGALPRPITRARATRVTSARRYATHATLCARRGSPSPCAKHRGDPVLRRSQCEDRLARLRCWAASTRGRSRARPHARAWATRLWWWAASTRGRSAPDQTRERAPRGSVLGRLYPGALPRPITRASVRHATLVLGPLYPGALRARADARARATRHRCWAFSTRGARAPNHTRERAHTRPWCWAASTRGRSRARSHERAARRDSRARHATQLTRPSAHRGARRFVCEAPGGPCAPKGPMWGPARDFGPGPPLVGGAPAPITRTRALRDATHERATRRDSREPLRTEELAVSCAKHPGDPVLRRGRCGGRLRATSVLGLVSRGRSRARSHLRASAAPPWCGPFPTPLRETESPRRG